MKVLLSFAVVTLISLNCLSQSYEQEFGVRFGESTGFVYKKHFNDYDAFRAMITFRKRGIQATALAEFHNPAFERSTPNFTWFWGLGAHLGYRKHQQCSVTIDGTSQLSVCERKIRPDIGVDALIGLDYTFYQVPLVLGLEYKPYINILDDNLINFHMLDFAFTITYAF